MEQYEKMELDVIVFESVDVITNSIELDPMP